jgi:hypothetical protein
MTGDESAPQGPWHDEPGGEAPRALPYEQAPPPPGHTTDPNVPDIFREVIPPTPRGWTDEEWRESYLGKPNPKATLGASLSVGRHWLLPVVVGAVVLILIVMAVLVIR